MSRVDLHSIPSFAEKLKQLEAFDEMDIEELSTRFGKAGDTINRYLGAEALSELKTEFDEFFINRAFIESDDLKWILPSLAHDVRQSDRQAGLDIGLSLELDVPDLEKSGPAFSVASLCTRILLNSAREGGRGRDVLIAAYKAFYPQEYKVLKKYRSLSFKDVLTLTKQESESFNLYAGTRYVILASLLQIELKPDIVCVYIAAEDMDNGFDERLGTPEENFRDYPCEDPFIIDDNASMVAETSAAETAYDRIFEMVSLALGCFNFPEYYIEHAFGGLEVNGQRDDAPDYYHGITQAYRILYNAGWDDMTDDNVGIMAALYHVIQVFCWSQKMLYADFLEGTGVIDHDAVFTSRYKKPPQAAAPGTEPTKPSSVDVSEFVREDKSELIDAMTELKQRLRVSRNSEKALHEQLEALRKENEELRRENAVLFAQKAEAAALREYVHSQETEQAVPAGMSRDEKIKALSGKKVIIVGGNPVWVSKVRSIFPEWVFVDPNADGATRAPLAGAEKAYFFTDTLSHKAYSAFLQRFRENRIKFGYIHGVNLDGNIDYIYNDVMGN